MSKIFLLKKDICLEHLKRFGYSESKICIYPKAMSKKISNYEEIRIYSDERNIWCCNLKEGFGTCSCDCKLLNDSIQDLIEVGFVEEEER